MPELALDRNPSPGEPRAEALVRRAAEECPDLVHRQDTVPGMTIRHLEDVLRPQCHPPFRDRDRAARATLAVAVVPTLIAAGAAWRGEVPLLCLSEAL